MMTAPVQSRPVYAVVPPALADGAWRALLGEDRKERAS